MQKFLLLLIFWNLITFIYYWLGKLSIRNLSEQKLIEIIASPFFNLTAPQKHKTVNWKVFVILIIGSISILLWSVDLVPYLLQLQIYLFNIPDGIFIGHNFFFLYLVILGFFFATVLIIAVLMMRKTPNIPIEKWHYFPDLAETKQKIKRIKHNLFLINSLLLLTFIVGMYDYTIFNKNVYIHNNFWGFSEKANHYEAIKKATLTYDYRRQTSSKSMTVRENLEPKFWIVTEKDSFNIWCSAVKVNHEKLKKVAKCLVDNQVNFHLKSPGVIEKYTWQKDYMKNDFDQIIGVYDYANQLKKGFLTPTKIGQPINYNDLVIRLDSAVFTNQHHILKAETEQLLTYFTINNTSEEDIYFGTLSNLKAVDETNNKNYSVSILIDNASSAVIPANQTVSTIQGFDIPNTSKAIKINYQPSVFENEFITFEINF